MPHNILRYIAFSLAALVLAGCLQNKNHPDTMDNMEAEAPPDMVPLTIPLLKTQPAEPDP